VFFFHLEKIFIDFDNIVFAKIIRFAVATGGFCSTMHITVMPSKSWSRRICEPLASMRKIKIKENPALWVKAENSGQ